MSRATATLLLLGGDYGAQLDRLYEAIEDAERAAERRADGDGIPQTMMETDDTVEALTRDYKALKDEAEQDARDARREVKMLAIGRGQWRDLKEKYPPRDEGTEDELRGDRSYGINADAAEDAVVHATITEPAAVACAGDMRVKSESCSPTNPCSHLNAFDEWADELSPGEWGMVVRAVWALAVGARFDPKPPPGSPIRSTGAS
jgi:hypothetical protein